MKHVYDLQGAVPGAARVAFGYFDGMHLGHQAVIDQLRGYEGQTPVLLSFSNEADPVIYTEEEKEYLLQGSGVEIMVSMPAANAENMTAEAFARDVLAGKLQARSVVVGEAMLFGSDRKSAADLAAYGQQYGFTVDTVPTVCVEGAPVSAEAIKEAISAGSFGRMQTLLGHTYIMQGVVVHGKAAGRKHGMPTANLGVAANKLFPPHGVYASLSYMDGTFFRGMTNIGLRPSDDDIPVATIETHLLNFDRDIYDKPITLNVYTYIRGVKKFAGGLDEVRKQIDHDIEAVRIYMDETVAQLKAKT